jgi:hypothetical protein
MHKWGTTDSSHLYILNLEGNKTAVKDVWKITRWNPKSRGKNADSLKMARKDGWDTMTRCACIGAFSVLNLFILWPY